MTHSRAPGAGGTAGYEHVLQTPPQGDCSLDQTGCDTLLASHLQEQGSLPFAQLQRALRLIREQRRSGVTLARALVEQGVMTAGAAEVALEHVRSQLASETVTL